MNNSRISSLLKCAPGVLLLCFAVLCGLHYFSARPLWLDETFILKNIEQRTYGQLFAPLGDSQAFPRVYLAGIKAVAGLFGNHVLALRFLPLLAMAAACAVWVKIYRGVFRNHQGFALALAAFCGSYYMVYYAAELKPYSMDVLVSGLFTYALISQERWGAWSRSGRAYWLCALPLLLFVSYVTPFFILLVPYCLLFYWNSQKALRPVLAGYILAAAVSMFFSYEIDLRHSAGVSTLQGYWESYYLSTQSAGDFAESFFEGFRKLALWFYGKGKFFLRTSTVFVLPVYLVSLFVFGVTSLRSERFRISTLDTVMFVVFLELFVLALLHKYPFTGARMTLFMAPMIIYTTAKGMLVLTVTRQKGARILGYTLSVLYGAFLLACLVFSFLQPVKSI